MLNLSVPYPYLLVVLVASTLVPGITAREGRGQRSLFSHSVEATEASILPQDASAITNLFNVKISPMCVSLTSCYNVLILIQQLQFELGYTTLQALVTRLTTQYDYQCYSTIVSLCLKYNINVGAIVSGVLYPDSKSVNATAEEPGTFGTMLEAIGINPEATGVTDLLTPRDQSPCACLLVTLIENIYNNCNIDNLLGINSPTLTALCQNNCCCGTGIL